MHSRCKIRHLLSLISEFRLNSVSVHVAMGKVSLRRRLIFQWRIPLHFTTHFQVTDGGICVAVPGSA